MIGRDGGLPWRMPSDLKTFRRLTMGKPIIMGRRTYASIGRPLDGRDNIVISRDPGFAPPPDVSVCASMAEALTLARVLAATRGADEIMVIGGAAIYEAALPHADRIYLTEIHAAPVGDRYFAKLDLQLWSVVSRTPIARGERDDHAATLVIYERANASGP